MVSEPWFSNVAENCFGTDVLDEGEVVCNSKEQLDHYFVRNTQEAAFQRIVFYRRDLRTWDFVRSGFSIVIQFHILSFFPIANMYLVL